MWDLREVHALWNGDCWVWNESFHIKNVYIQKEENPEAIFYSECCSRYPKQVMERCEWVDDGYVLELQFIDTHEPFFAMVKVEG